jgi:hypothetical protein
MEPWPKTYTHWLRRGAEPMRLILGRTAVIEEAADAGPGIVVRSGGSELVVASDCFLRRSFYAATH